MKDIYITNYSHYGCEPLKSITQLDEEEAYRVAHELSKNNSGSAFNRFGDDFQYYYPKRIRTENWLYQNFKQLGGMPQFKHPYYFVLHGCEYLHEWFDKGRITKLLLDNISSRDISFTLGDSMGQMDRPSRREPFSKEELYKMLSDYSDVNHFLKSLNYHYIEAQLWNSKYLNDVIIELMG